MTLKESPLALILSVHISHRIPTPPKQILSDIDETLHSCSI